MSENGALCLPISSSSTKLNSNKLARVKTKIWGLPSHSSQHAAAVVRVVSTVPLVNISSTVLVIGTSYTVSVMMDITAD